MPGQWVYEYPGDEKGVLYYLGTNEGSSDTWVNPHLTKTVQVFASSLNSGNLDNFIDRTYDDPNMVFPRNKQKNTPRTDNEENSWLAIDLGKERCLFPSCYVIRNRNAKVHTLLNWKLQGSREFDKHKWITLDERIHMTGETLKDKDLEPDRKELTKEMAISAWEVNIHKIPKALVGPKGN
jgi:hypothetical protein